MLEVTHSSDFGVAFPQKINFDIFLCEMSKNYENRLFYSGSLDPVKSLGKCGNLSSSHQMSLPQPD